MTAPFLIDLRLLQRCLEASTLCREVHNRDPRSFLECFQDEAESFVRTELATSYGLGEATVDATAFATELATLSTDDVVTPKMTCADLVDCTCETPCDWQHAFDTAHDFSEASLAHASKDTVFVLLADAEGALATFVHE